MTTPNNEAVRDNLSLNHESIVRTRLLQNQLWDTLVEPKNYRLIQTELAEMLDELKHIRDSMIERHNENVQLWDQQVGLANASVLYIE